MSLIGAVTPSEQPQVGVKRPLRGNPTSVPNNLPAFRGRSVDPDSAIKVPKLSQGNRPNEGSNIAIPYSRVCPLRLLNTWTGRLAPGDVAFILKTPPGFLSKFPHGNHGTNGTATMSEVIGVDGLNRQLHGSGSVWRVGFNVLVLDEYGDRDFDATSPLKLKTMIDQQAYKDWKKTQENLILPLQTAVNTASDAAARKKAEYELELFKFRQEEKDAEWKQQRWRLSVLDQVRLDGIVKSNDEPFCSTSNGERDAVVFNNVIQGPTLVNNGYLLYEPEANPSYKVQKPGGGNEPGALRTVEAHPRGSIEGGYHIGGGGRPGQVGSQGWLGKGMYDYVAAFTGSYTAYPAQMFDRQIEPMSSLYLGLRAYEMSVAEKKKIRNRNDDDLLFGGDETAAKAKRCFFYQVMPFSSRKAWLCQHVQDTIKANLNVGYDAKGYKTAVQTLDEINNRIHGQTREAKRSRFDEDVFDAVRSEDLANMVGAWHVGRVLDVKAQRQTSYMGGPADGSFAMMVDVQVGWRNARPQKDGRSYDPEEQRKQSEEDRLNSTMDYSSSDVVKEPAVRHRQARRALDMHNAEFPSMQQSVGTIFGSKFSRTMSVTSEEIQAMSVRWPVITEFWEEMVKEVASVTDSLRYPSGLGTNTSPLNAIAVSIKVLKEYLLTYLEKAPSVQAVGLKRGSQSRADFGTQIEKVLIGLKFKRNGKVVKGFVGKDQLFYVLGGARIRSKPDRERWFTEGSKAFPTLASLADIPDDEMTMEHVESMFDLMHGDDTEFVSLYDDDEPDLLMEAETEAVPMQMEPEAAPVETPVSTSAPVAPIATEAPEATPAPAPAPTAETSASMAALERTAPVTAAAMAANARKKGKSPTRTRPTAAAAAATAVPPPGAAGVSSTPLLPSLAPSVDAGAGVGGAPVQSRRRGAAAAQPSTVASVFDSIFGAGLEQEAAAATTETPASPTPSSGSEQGSSTGPKTFRRSTGGRPR